MAPSECLMTCPRRRTSVPAHTAHVPPPSPHQLRFDLERTWDDVTAGRLSRAAAADWAAHSDRAVDYSTGPEPLHQAWLLLHDLRQAPLEEAATTSGGPHDRDYLAARQHQLWRDQLACYDADPLQWNRAYWSTYLHRISTTGRHPVPSRLAARLIEHGLIHDEDAAQVLGNAWPPSP